MRERKFITESVKKLLVSEYIRKETESAGFGSMVMKRTPFGTNITLHVNKPGLVIGRRGSKIQEITENLEKIYSVESPQIEVKEAENPDLNPQVVSKKIALSLEKGWSYRKAGNTSLRRAIDSDVRGIMIKVSGKLTGERSRTQKFFHGSVKYSGEPGRAAMLNGFSIAKMKQGVIGVTVRILDPDYRLPDEISMADGGVRRVIETQEKPEAVEEIPVEQPKEVAPAGKDEIPKPEKTKTEVKPGKEEPSKEKEQPKEVKPEPKQEKKSDKKTEKKPAGKKVPEPEKPAPEPEKKAPVKEEKKLKKAEPKKEAPAKEEKKAAKAEPKKSTRSKKVKESEPKEEPKAEPKKRGRKPKTAKAEKGSETSKESEEKSEETDGAESEKN